MHDVLGCRLSERGQRRPKTIQKGRRRDDANHPAEVLELIVARAGLVEHQSGTLYIQIATVWNGLVLDLGHRDTGLFPKRLGEVLPGDANQELVGIRSYDGHF